jgi:hypothetical protein
MLKRLMTSLRGGLGFAGSVCDDRSGQVCRAMKFALGTCR